MKIESNSKIRQEYYIHRKDENGNAKISKHGLFGIIDENDAIILPCIYQIILPIGKMPVQYDPGVLCFGEEGYAAVKLGGKWGVADRSNNLVLPCVYDKVLNYSEGIFNIIKNGLCGSINKEGKTIVNFKYTQILPYIDGYAIYYIATKRYPNYSERYGILDKVGNVVFDTEFAHIFRLPNGFLAGVDKDSYSLILDKHGNRTTVENIRYVESFKDGLAIYHTPEGKSGVMNSEGKVIISARYNGILEGKKYFYTYQTSDEGDEIHFVIDKFGSIVKQIEGIYWIILWHDIIFFQIKKEKYKSMHGVMDEDLNIILPATYNNLRWVASGLICAEIGNSEQVLIDYSGKKLMIIDRPVYNLGLSYGLSSLPILVSVNGIYLQIDANANILRRLPYSVVHQEIGYFRDKPYCLHYVFMGLKIDPRSTSFPKEKKGIKGGILDDKMNVVVGAKYTTISHLKKHRDLFIVGLGKERVTYDKDRDPLTASGLKFGVVNKKEEFIVPPVYDRIVETSYNLFLVQRGGEDVFDQDEYEWYYSGGKKGLVNLEGTEVVPLIYKAITIYNYIIAYYEHPTFSDAPKYDVYDLFGNKVKSNIEFTTEENKLHAEYF